MALQVSFHSTSLRQARLAARLSAAPYAVLPLPFMLRAIDIAPLPKGSRMRVRIRHPDAQFTAIARVIDDRSEERDGSRIAKGRPFIMRRVFGIWLSGLSECDFSRAYLLFIFGPAWSRGFYWSSVTHQTVTSDRLRTDCVPPCCRSLRDTGRNSSRCSRR